MTDATPKTLSPAVVTEALLPCPFCGGAGKSVHSNWHSREYWGVECQGTCANFFDCRKATEEDALAAWNTRLACLASPERPVEREGWQPIETAPKDNTIVELVVDYSDGDHPLQDATTACTIGFNSFDDSGEDEWKFAGWCWTHDHFVQGKGKVVGWRPSRLNACDSGLSPILSELSGRSGV